jgi:hypothetical protein
MPHPTLFIWLRDKRKQHNFALSAKTSNTGCVVHNFKVNKFEQIKNIKI